MSEKRLNLSEISRSFGVSRVTIRDWLLKGLPSKRSSKGYSFDLAECIKWRESRLKESQVSGNAYDQAKTEREIYKAKTAKLVFERMDGTLVLAKEVGKVAFETARKTRDSLLCIPSRIGDILAGEINKDGKIDRQKVNEILMREIRQALENLANNWIKNGQAEILEGEKYAGTENRG